MKPMDWYSPLKWPRQPDISTKQWNLWKAALKGSFTLTGIDRNYTAMRTHVWWSVHLSALLISWFTWGDGLQRRYTSDVAFCIVCFPLTVDNSDMN
jgi:hypothetical protein